MRNPQSNSRALYPRFMAAACIPKHSLYTSSMPPISLKWLRLAAALTIGVHVLGLIAAIGPGTAVFPDAQRIAHVGASWAWKIGWLVWLFGAVSFVVFNAAVEKSWKLSGVCARLGVCIGVAAASLDCVFDALQIIVLPEFAASGRGTQVFLALARFASVGGIVVANGLYSISVALLSCALREQISRCSLVLGWATLVTGLALSAVGFGSDAHLPEIFAGPVFAAYLLWVFALAWKGPPLTPDP